jgi:hypothetical protein
MEELQEFWPQLATLVLVVVWLIRFEGRMNAASAAIEGLRLQRKEDLQRADTQRQDDRRHADLQRGELHDMLVNVQGDIKQILKEIRK